MTVLEQLDRLRDRYIKKMDAAYPGTDHQYIWWERESQCYWKVWCDKTMDYKNGMSNTKVLSTMRAWVKRAFDYKEQEHLRAIIAKAKADLRELSPNLS